MVKTVKGSIEYVLVVINVSPVGGLLYIYTNRLFVCIGISTLCGLTGSACMREHMAKIYSSLQLIQATATGKLISQGVDDKTL